MPKSTGTPSNVENNGPEDPLFTQVSTNQPVPAEAVTPLLNWIKAQKERKGEYPSVKLTPQLVNLMTGQSHLSPRKQSELVLSLSNSLANHKTQSQVQSPDLAPTAFNVLHPLVSSRTTMTPTSKPSEFHHFMTERSELGRIIALKQKLGVVNPLSPFKPESVMAMEDLPGWGLAPIKEGVDDWGIHTAHLMWLGLLFRNESDIMDLRQRRLLINTPKYADLKEAYAMMDLGTPL